MSKSNTPLDYLNALDRYKFLTILNAANECEEFQFAKQACMLWLVNYPGDLYVQYQQASTYSKLGLQDQSSVILGRLVELDPQFIEAYALLSEQKDETETKAIIDYLTLETPPADRSADWLTPLWEARQAYAAGDMEKTTQLVHQSLLQNPASPLPAILHLKAAYQTQNKALLLTLSDIYYEQWPDCLQVNITKALAEMEKDQNSSAVERLHWAAAHDSAGQVITRLLGQHHRFRDLWPESMEIYFDIAIPAPVSSFLGWNQIAMGTEPSPELSTLNETGAPQEENEEKEPASALKPHPEKASAKAAADQNQSDTPSIPEKANLKPEPEPWATDEDFEDIQEAFSHLAKRFKKSDIERADNRYPVYVILSSKAQLETQYGPNTAVVIDELLQQLATLINQLPEWGARVFYPDDPGSMAQMGLKPAPAGDAWKVKLSLADLDQALGAQGEMIGALLIVGGPDIIPFHKLPNPTMDSDLEVPSDNPYATIDENYFLPQWPVGRLPGESGSDAGLLLYQIRQLIYQYEQRTQKGFLSGVTFSSLFSWLHQWWNAINNVGNKNQRMGYSAEVWKEASEGVYQTIGKSKDLAFSPPTHAGNIVLYAQGPELGYFNLHGVEDGPDWYGQKDFSSDSSGPDYPVALSPSLFSEKLPSPGLVFSEACYGANIQGKAHDEAMSLKFMDSGTKAFVGSTCIAYGSVTTPLIAADYLAQLYWKQVLEGDAAGYALMRAKLTLAQEMTRIQGFLDGEDQKTLLSFILYGDPLATYDGQKTMPKPLFRAKTHPAVKTISDGDLQPAEANAPIPHRVSQSVKKTVEKYLPGLHNAEMKVSHPTGKPFPDGSKAPDDGRYYITLEKSVDVNQHTTHHHYARMTFDSKGKLVKLTTSR